MPHVLFLTLWLNLQVYCRCCVYKRSLRSTLLDKFIGRRNGSSFHAEFTGQVYRQTLLVLFTGLVYLSCFVLHYKPSLWIRFTIVFYSLNSLIKFTGRVCGS